MVNPLRFSLAGLIGVILLVSVYLATLRTSSTSGAGLALSISVGVLTAGLFWGLFRPGANRGFWVGFQLAGWGYLLAAVSGSSQSQLGNHLITTQLVGALYRQMPVTSTQGVMVEWHGTWYAAEVLRRSGARHYIHYTGYGANWDEWVGPDRIRGQFGPFLQICHALLSLILALAGGAVGGCLGAVNRSRRWFWIPWGGCAAAAVGTSLLAMATDSDLAAGAAWSLLLVLLVLAAIAAWGGPERRSSFALGFAIVGCGYLLLHFGPGLETTVGPNLLSTRLLQLVHDWLHPEAAQTVSPAWPYTGTIGSGRVSWAPTYVGIGYSTAVSICVLAGHCLLATLLGLLGGFAALWLSRWRRPDQGRQDAAHA